MPENEVGAYYHSLLQEQLGEAKIPLPGSYRSIIGKPIDLEFQIDMEAKNVHLQFSLQKGMYATTFINELTGGGCT